MKKQMKIFYYLIAIFAIIINWSCEKDLYEESMQKYKNFRFKTVTLKEVKQLNSKTADFIEKKIINNQHEIHEKTSHIYGKTVDTTYINYVVKNNGYSSFTFKVINNSSEINYFENLIIENYPNQTQKIVSIKFNLNKSISEFLSSNSTLLNSLISTETLVIENKTENQSENQTQSFGSGDCITVGYYVTVDKCNGELVTPQEKPSCFNADGSRATKEVFITIAEGCGDSSSSGNSGSFNNNGGYINPFNGSNGTGSDGGYDDSGIFIPIIYTGDEDPNNIDFMLAANVSSYFNSLPQNLKNLKNDNTWVFSYLVNFFRENGYVVNSTNSQNATIALNNYYNFQLNLSNPNIINTSNDRLKFWGYYNYLYNNENGINTTKINNVRNLITNPNINSSTKEKIIDELATKNNQEVLEFISELSQLSQNEPNQQDVDELVNMSLIFEKYKDNFDNENFILEMDQYMVDLDTIAFMLSNPGIAFSNYFTLQCAVLRKNHPSWSDAKIYWEAAKVFVHIALDVAGLVPVVGEVADLTNGLLYVIEGDGVNAALSVASAIPIVGWASVTTKYAIKITSVGSTKVVLTWKKIGNLIDFGNRADLRKMLGLAVGNTLQAHHIVPWAIRQHDVIQKAAKSIQAFHMNETLNGIAVAAWRNQPNHNTYNNLIKSKLDALPSNLTPDQAFDEVVNILNQARQAIINNPNLHLNDIVF